MPVRWLSDWAHCSKPWGYVPNDPDTSSCANIVSDILIDTRVFATTDKLMACTQTFSPRVAKCGALIGPDTASSSIEADARGRISITYHSRHSDLYAYSHSDIDFALDLLSTNRSFLPNTDLAVLGTVVVAGPTTDRIQVLVPDCTVPPVEKNIE